MTDITQAYVQTFSSNIRFLAQQSDTRLLACVTVENENSESHNWETLEAFGDAGLKGDGTRDVGTGILIDTPHEDGQFAVRRTLINTYDHGTSTEKEDIVQMLIDPNSNLVQAQAMTMKRKIDDIIVDSSFADAPIKTHTGFGQGDNGVVTWASLGGSQTVGDYTAPISFDMVTEVTEIFLRNDIDPSEEKFMIIGPTQMRKLLQITEATNADYVEVKVLQSLGIVRNWMGFTWILSNRLNIPLVDQIQCICMTRKALGLHIAKDISSKVAEDPSKSFAWRIYSYLSMDCVRVEDKHIVELQLADTL